MPTASHPVRREQVGQTLVTARGETFEVAVVVGHARAGDRPPGAATASVRSWFACAVSLLRADEGAGAWLCVSTEVTDLKRTEERLRRADTQGVAHLGTREWDISEPHAFWSAELYRIYGLTPDTYVPTYEAYLTKVHPEDRQRVRFRAS